MTQTPTKKHWLVRMHYRMRTLSFAMVFVATYLHIEGKNYSLSAWMLLVMILLVYPHAQYWRSLKADDSIKAEMTNLLVDSVLLGIFIITVEFSDWLTFSVMMGTLSNNAANKGWRGIRDALLGLMGGVLIGIITGGWHFSPHTERPAMLFCMVGLGGYLLAMNKIGFARNVQLRLTREQLGLHVVRESKARDEQARFIAMLSHELKTPLSVIDGAAQALERIDHSNNPEVKRRHERIRRSVSRIDRLIEQFLTNDRLDTEVSDIYHDKINVTELLRQVADTSADGIDRLRLNAPDSLSLVADSALLRIAVTNLTDNALKYSPHDSVVSISAMQREEKNLAGVEIVVADEGPGISPEFHSRLFSRYSRGDNVDHIPGAGLGLHLVRCIAELHGGQIELLSRDGGAVFRLWIPTGMEDRT